jgi:hypothetical protein
MDIVSIILGQMTVWVLSNSGTQFQGLFLTHDGDKVGPITCLHEYGVLGLHH